MLLQRGGPDGGGVVVGDVAAVEDGCELLADVLGVALETGVDDGAETEVAGTALETGVDGGGDDVLPLPDVVHAAAATATVASAPASRARVNCRSAGRSRTAGSSAVVAVRR